MVTVFHSMQDAPTFYRKNILGRNLPYLSAVKMHADFIIYYTHTILNKVLHLQIYLPLEVQTVLNCILDPAKNLMMNLLVVQKMVVVGHPL